MNRVSIEIYGNSVTGTHIYFSINKLLIKRWNWIKCAAKKREYRREIPREKETPRIQPKLRTHKTAEETIYWTSGLKIISHQVCIIQVLQPNTIIPHRNSFISDTIELLSTYFHYCSLIAYLSNLQALDHRIWHYPLVITSTPLIQNVSFGKGDHNFIMNQVGYTNTSQR